MTDQELKEVIRQAAKEAVEGAEDRFKGFMDQAEERFGKRLDRRLAEEIQASEKRLTTEINYVKDRVSSLERTMKDSFKKFEAMERGDIGGVIKDTDKLKKTAANHEKRITALEQVRG